MPSNPSLGMYPAWAVVRALSQVGKGKYGLGKGGRNPYALTPFVAGVCDCSGFVAWCLGYDRVQDLGEDTETWYSTTEMVADAMTKPYLMFRKVGLREKVREGDVIVYPAGNGRKYGHVGVITGVLPGFKRLAEGWWAHLEVTHCTTGYKTAIVTTNALLWANRGGYILRYVHQEE